MAGPNLPDFKTLIQAGIDPKTGRPIRGYQCDYKENIKKLIRIKDEQDAVNRFVWYNLPNDLSSQELERLLYYKGQLVFFYEKTLKKWYFMPYALSGTIDFYGRYNRVHPVPMSSGGDESDNKAITAQRDILSKIQLDIIKDIVMAEDVIDQDIEEYISTHGVILRDYTNQMGQSIIARQILNEGIIDIESDCIPFMRTALLNSTGVMGMRVNSQDEESNVLAASKSIDRAALNGEKYIPIIGNIDFQDLTGPNVGTADQFLLSMQALDNFRLSTYGLDNAGLFQKNQYISDAQNQINAGNVGSVLQDSLSQRQRFCDIVNSYTGLGIWCEVAENAIGVDMNGDGMAGGDQTQETDEGGEEDAE